MKKLLFALSILGFTYLSADAQTVTTTTTTTVVKKTVTDTPNYAKQAKVVKGKSTYYSTNGTVKKTTTKTVKTTAPKTAQTAGTNSIYAKNYSVCKGKGNYHICDEKPNAMNSVPANTTPVSTTAASKTPITKTTEVTENGVVATTSNQTFATQPTAAPQLQSISDQSDNSLTPVTVKAHVDSINNANAPYHGKNSPQYDGVERNKLRNLNTPPQSPNSLPLTR